MQENLFSSGEMQPGIITAKASAEALKVNQNLSVRPCFIRMDRQPEEVGDATQLRGIQRAIEVFE